MRQKASRWMGVGKKLLEKLRGMARVPRIFKSPKIDILVIGGLMLIAGYLTLAVIMRTPQPFAGVASGSMEPYLSRGNLIIIKNVPPGEIREGDVIVHTAREGGGSYSRVHRVVRVEKDPAAGLVFWTKGDALDRMDATGTVAEDVKGRVARKVPIIGYFWLFFWGKYGIVLACVALALYIVIYKGEQVLRYAKTIRVRRPEPEVIARLDRVEEALRELARAISEQNQNRSD